MLTGTIHPMKTRQLTLLIFLFSCKVLSAQNTLCDSLEKARSQTTIDSLKLQLLTDLNWEYLSFDLIKAQKCAEEELALAQKINNTKFVAQAYNDFGLVCIKQSKFKEALNWHRQALSIRESLPSQYDLASSYSKMGYCYSELDQYANALYYQLKALQIYKSINDKVKTAYTLNNLCYLYSALFNWDKNIELAKQAYQIGLEIDNAAIKAVALNNIGSSFEKKKDYTSAIKYKLIAYHEFEKMQDSSSMGSMLNNIGYYYRNLGNNKMALQYYTKGLAVSSAVNDLNSIALFHSNLGALNLDLNQLEEAQLHLLIAEKMGLSQSAAGTLIPVYKSLGDLNALKGNGKIAKDYYNKYASLKDSLFNSDLARQFSDMQTRYETNEKEAANQLLQKENELAKADLQKSKLEKLGITVGMALLILLIWLFFKNKSYRQKQVRDTERLQQQEQNAMAVLVAEEKERQRIARDLHDGIGQRLSAAKINVSGLQSMPSQNNPQQEILFSNAIQLLDDSVKDVRSISHNLMANGLIKAGLASAIRDFVNQIQTPAGFKINLEIVGIHARLEYTIENTLYRVLQEIIHNVIKHASATEVSIQLIKHDHELTLLVQDNGVGFLVDETLQNGKGIGLKNMESRLSFIHGKVYFDSYPGKGTTISIEVPLP